MFHQWPELSVFFFRQRAGLISASCLRSVLTDCTAAHVLDPSSPVIATVITTIIHSVTTTTTWPISH